MNRRSFIRTLTASGVSLFLPKVIDPMRWKRNLFWMGMDVSRSRFTGVSTYVEITEEDLASMREDLWQEPFSVSAVMFHTPEDMERLKRFTKQLEQQS